MSASTDSTTPPEATPEQASVRFWQAQIEPTLGDLETNLATHLTAIDQAASAGADIVLFPELSLTGYFLKDLTSEVARALDSNEIRVLLEASKRISLAFGFVEAAPDGRLYNSVAFCEDGAILHVHRKVHLVTYGMFEESRDFAAGEEFAVFDSRHGRFGILICEDAWHMGGAYLHYMSGADALLVHSSSPARGVQAIPPTSGDECDEPCTLASNRTWETLLSALSLFFRTPVVFTNRVGVEDGITFSGDSRVIGPDGASLGRLQGLGPGHLDTTVDSHHVRRARRATPLRRDEKPWLLFKGLASLEGFQVDEE
ncbi:MAG: nitrilase-related carbon-nitrogen hydrolase [Planctomycetota bacterium]|nr:carbon-nitrogen hydrolase [Planctomycetota bacterium]MDP6520519.1 nitrilase-related carbon-nitrogen hydrolase [Planctomycetota bacterium]MDP6954502.1 nitrilase-related carbon-nitrogen hydrolase [Planctomycetota bacterium]